MSSGGAPVAFGQTAPGDETHYAVAVAAQDRGAAAMHRVHDRVERRAIDGFERFRTIEPVGEAIERRLLVGAPGDDRFGALARGHVVGDFRYADDRAVLVMHWRHSERNINQPPILTAPDGFVVLDPLAAPDPLQDLRLFALPVIGNDHGDGFADYFFGQISKQTFGARIPADDDAAQIHADDRVVGGFHDAGELPAGLLAAALLGNVEQRSDPAFDIAGGIEFGPIRDRQPADAAVGK